MTEKLSVLIAVPVLNKVEPETLVSLWNLKDRTKGVNIQLMCIEGCTVIHALRNDIVKKFLNLHSFEYLFFIDADMSFPPDILDILLQRHKDIVGALYVGRTKPYMPCVFEMKKEPLEFPNIIKLQGEFFKVGAISTGCLLIHRRVFERIPYPWFGWKKGIPGEDLFFCWKASQYGFDIWCDASRKIYHVSKTQIGFEDFIRFSKSVEGQTLIQKGAQRES